MELFGSLGMPLPVLNAYPAGHRSFGGPLLVAGLGSPRSEARPNLKL